MVNNTSDATDAEDDENAKLLKALMLNSDDFFRIVMAVIIFFMQCGFAFLEAGSVRAKNTTNILLKNMLDAFIGSIIYWAVGYGLAYGDGNFFCGTKYFFNIDLPPHDISAWIFQFVFAVTAATIVSGAVAERCNFRAYFVYTMVLTGFVYPIVSHWCWAGNGWLLTAGYVDFAGSGTVHLTGGVAALVGSIFLGPRIGKFSEDGSRELRGHSVPLTALGGFILIFGFLAFNGGSQTHISQRGDGPVIAKAILNTIIGGCTGGLVALFAYKMGLLGESAWSLLINLNGCLTGMIAMCGGCHLMEAWGAIVTGVVAAFVYLGMRHLQRIAKVDDPLDAFPVHGGGGAWGLVATAIFADGGVISGSGTHMKQPPSPTPAGHKFHFHGWQMKRCPSLHTAADQWSVKREDKHKHTKPDPGLEHSRNDCHHYLDRRVISDHVCFTKICKYVAGQHRIGRRRYGYYGA